jgi:hypothetical protein
MIKRKIMITLAATVAAMTLVTGCGKKTTSMTEISREDLVQVTKDSDENETSGDKTLPTTTKETEKSTKESASEGKEAETTSGTDETDIKPEETSEKADAKPAQSQTSKPAVSEQKTKPAANTPEKSDTKPVQSQTSKPAVNEQQTKPVQKPSQAVTQPATKAPAATPVTKPTEPQKPKVKTMWDAPYDVEGIKAYIIKELKARGYSYGPEYSKEKYGVESDDITPDEAAWDNYCTTTAGPQRYYDKVNKCAVGHQHYKWSEPFNGSIAENAEASTEWMVNHAINYWDNIYGKEYDYPVFSVYVEQFDDGCVIFYILAG